MTLKHRHHFPCPGGCGELADECRCARPNPLGSMRIIPPAEGPHWSDLPEWLVYCVHDPVCASEDECDALLRADDPDDSFAHDWAADARWDR